MDKLSKYEVCVYFRIRFQPSEMSKLYEWIWCVGFLCLLVIVWEFSGYGKCGSK